MAKRSTPAQTFRSIFERWMRGSTEQEKRNAKGRLDAWLKRHDKTDADISAVLAQAAEDDKATAPPPPPSDPRDTRSNPFTDPGFTAAGLVQAIAEKYLFMAWYVSAIYTLWIVFAHVYERFEVAPRLWMASEGPDAGKSTARKVAAHLVFRPNEEALGTAAAIRDHMSQGPGTVLLDELDYLDDKALRDIRKLWNLGHERGAKISLMVKGERTLVPMYAPILGAGLGDFLEPTQQSRTFRLDMEPYTEETKPEREYDSTDVEELDLVYVYLRNWARTVNLDPNPDTTGLLRRFADNARGLLAVADSCGPVWSKLARDALMVFAEREKAALPHYLIIKHGIVIFDAAGLDQPDDVISTMKFNRELRLLDLPDAHWSSYRGPGGMAYPHPIRIGEQAALLRRKPNTVVSKSHWPAGRRQGSSSIKVYRRGDFEMAMSRWESAPRRPRLVTSS
jgi:hypothetical protein